MHHAHTEGLLCNRGALYMKSTIMFKNLFKTVSLHLIYRDVAATEHEITNISF